MLPRAASVAVALAVPPVLFTASVGQNGLLTAALLGASLALLDRRPVAAGVALGLLTIKPQLGLLFPLLLAAGGHWRAFGVAAVTAVILAAAAWLAFGGESWAAFLASSGGNAARMLATGQEVSPKALADRLNRTADEAIEEARGLKARAASIPEHAGPVELDAKIRVIHGREQIATTAKGFAPAATAFAGWVDSLS